MNTLVPLPTPETKAKRPAVVAIDERLHDALRVKAATERRTIKEIVETKLWELFPGPVAIDNPPAS